MRATLFLLLLQCSVFLVTSQDLPESKDLGDEDYDDLGRKHRKRKKHQNNPCYGAYGRTFGEKFGHQDYTYVSAPVNNYYLGCGGAAPFAPAPFPVAVGQHGHGHGHGGHGGHGSHGHGNQPNLGYNPGYNQGYQPYQYNQYNRPFQNVVSAAASGFGNAVSNYFNRPRKFNNNDEEICNGYQSRMHLEGKSQSSSDDDGHYRATYPTSYLDTLLHLFRGNIGSGLLAMGDAYKNGGIIFSPIMTAILGIICVHSQHLLLNCSDEMYRKTKRDRPPGFADTVALVFEYGPVRLRRLAPLMKVLVNTFLCVTQLGFCCIYIVFIANNIKTICDQYDLHIDLSIHIIFVFMPVLVLCMVRNLKYLTPFSTLANLLMAIGVGAVLYEASQNLPPVHSRDYLATWYQLPLYFGTAVYAFEGIGLVLPLKNEMKNPDHFQKPFGVLNVGMVFVGSTFIVVGFLGYLQWGNDVAGSLTLNLKPGQVLSMTVQILITLAMLFTYPLQFYVPIAITWPAIRNKYGQKQPVAKELGYRAFMVMITFVLAESIPQLGLFISLVGAISSTALALMFPPLIQTVASLHNNNKVPALMALKNALIFLLGLFIFVTGTYESVGSIVRAF